MSPLFILVWLAVSTVKWDDVVHEGMMAFVFLFFFGILELEFGNWNDGIGSLCLVNLSSV